MIRLIGLNVAWIDSKFVTKILDRSEILNRFNIGDVVSSVVNYGGDRKIPDCDVGTVRQVRMCEGNKHRQLFRVEGDDTWRESLDFLRIRGMTVVPVNASVSTNEIPHRFNPGDIVRHKIRKDYDPLTVKIVYYNSLLKIWTFKAETGDSVFDASEYEKVDENPPFQKDEWVYVSEETLLDGNVRPHHVYQIDRCEKSPRVIIENGGSTWMVYLKVSNYHGIESRNFRKCDGDFEPPFYPGETVETKPKEGWTQTTRFVGSVWMEGGIWYICDSKMEGTGIRFKAEEYQKSTSPFQIGDEVMHVGENSITISGKEYQVDKFSLSIDNEIKKTFIVKKTWLCDSKWWFAPEGVDCGFQSAFFKKVEAVAGEQKTANKPTQPLEYEPNWGISHIFVEQIRDTIQKADDEKILNLKAGEDKLEVASNLLGALLSHSTKTILDFGRQPVATKEEMEILIRLNEVELEFNKLPTHGLSSSGVFYRGIHECRSAISQVITERAMDCRLEMVKQ